MKVLFLAFWLVFAVHDWFPRERQPESVRKVKPCIAIDKCITDECRLARVPPECM
jgi:hypothetical protein